VVIRSFTNWHSRHAVYITQTKFLLMHTENITSLYIQGALFAYLSLSMHVSFMSEVRYNFLQSTVSIVWRYIYYLD